MSVKYTFKCPKCKQDNVPYEIRLGLTECDTPVGTIRATEDRAFCKQCGEQLYSRQLRDVNYMLMVRATMALWRNQNPQGTRKQCHRALGLQKRTVDTFWESCMKELPKRYEEETDDETKKD